MRTNTLGAVFRLRLQLAFAVHRFFMERGFVHVHTPIRTARDCEGAGVLFTVTALEPEPVKPHFCFGKTCTCMCSAIPI